MKMSAAGVVGGGGMASAAVAAPTVPGVKVDDKYAFMAKAAAAPAAMSGAADAAWDD
jgi:hypothetical protein